MPIHMERAIGHLLDVQASKEYGIHEKEKERN